MIRRLRTVLLSSLVIFAAIFYFLAVYPLRNPHPALQLPVDTLAIRDARVYLSPDEPAQDHVNILVRNGRIAALGPGVVIPPEAQVIPCDHCIVTAGFWNVHVHFTERKWSNSGYKQAATLENQLADMLTSRGFTTVADLGSNAYDTIPLRRRIETGNVLGPFIYTAGSAQYPPQGIPFYLRETLPWFILRLMPQPDTPDEAARTARRNIGRGADLLKLFTGSYVERNFIKPMPVANAAAAVQVAHQHGQLVFAHPSNLVGVTVARDAGVDVLAHAADTTDDVTPALLQTIVDHHMAMVPTLKMFRTTVTTDPAYLDPIYAEVRQFHALHGELLFGTDVGYMADYTTQDEFQALTQSGLGFEDILRMLTTAPAARFGVDREKGTVTPGKLADLVVLGSDPAQSPLSFSDVRATIRSGRVLYQRQP